MVAYQGDVTFEHAGSGGLGRMLKKAVTGEGIDLMKVTGHGEVFLADQAQDIHLIYLENDYITVNGPNLLAFDSGIDWDIRRVEGASVDDGRRPLQHEPPRHRLGGDHLRRSSGAAQRRRRADVRRRAGRDHVVVGRARPAIRTDFKMKNLIGKSSGETVQMSFSGQGWVLVQPSEGQVAGAPQGAAEQRWAWARS